MCDSHCTDRPELARVAGSSTISTGIRPIDQPGAAGRVGCAVSVQVIDHFAMVESCGQRDHVWAKGDRSAGAVHVLVWGLDLLRLRCMHAPFGYSGQHS